jgi:hypothetical protein
MLKLGLTNETPRSDGRLKSLFWPTIHNETDVDSLGGQGLWLCYVLAAFTLAVTVFRMFTAPGIPFGILDVLFFLLAGLGIRERDRLAAVAAFAIYLLGQIAAIRLTGQGVGILPILFSALLLSNVRGTWLASQAAFSAGDFDRERLNETMADRIADQWPRILWPRMKWLFWLLTAIECISLVASFWVSAHRY